MFDIAVSRMKGHGRPAHQVWLPPLDVPNSMDQLLGDLAPHPELGLVSTRWRERGLVRAAGRHRRPAARAAPRALRAAARRGVRARRGRRRPALRALDDGAHHRHGDRAHDHAAREPGLRARLRRGHLHPAGQAGPRRRGRQPQRARGGAPARRRGARHRRRPRALLPGARHRLDRDLPQPPGRPAGSTTATATSSSSSTAGPRCAPSSTSSSRRSTSWPGAG